MATKNWNAGVIRPVAVAPTGPYQDGAASGVWSLDQAAYWSKQGLWPIAGNAAPIALFGPGSGDNTLNVISRLVVATLGNATDFGDFAISGSNGPLYYCAFGSNTRCVWSSGQVAGSGTTNISYSTYATAGNATNFGSLTLARYDTIGMSNYVRGITGGGYAADRSNVLDYVTIATTGNAVDFGDSSGGFYNSPGGFASSTRGVFALGYGGPSNARTNIIEYVTIASAGNSTDFGDLSVVRNQVCGASNNTTGIFCGGLDNTATEVNVMDYITIASAGNATDFGDLTQAVSRASATASPTRLVRGGGSPTTNTIDYVEIASTGNATDFGDLIAPGYTGARFGLAAACSGASAVQPTPTSSAMALFGGGYSTGVGSAYQAAVQYVNIATTGNSAMFSSLTQARYSLAACASSTRGLFAGGTTGSDVNTIDYITFSSFGAAVDFGDRTVAKRQLAACSSDTRGVFIGGGTPAVNVIDYVTMASAGNATDFGDMGAGADYGMSGCGSNTRGLFANGYTNYLDRIDYITIATTGNSTNFGSLAGLWGVRNGASCSNSTRGLFAGGSNGSYSINVIEYVTIASTGNGTDFGDLTAEISNFAGAASSTTGVFAGGNPEGGNPINTIQYVTIASTGNATTFGDLTSKALNQEGGCSNAHGGL